MTDPDPDPDPDPALGIVPVTHDDRDAPAGCAALRELRGLTLVRRAVGALARSGRVSRVLVPAPPALLAVLAEQLRAGLPASVDVEVIPVTENGPGARVRAVLAGAAAAVCADPAGVVVVHDPLHPLAPSGLVHAVVDLLAAEQGGGACAGVVPVRPVTDTLKWVDEDDVVTGTADRQTFRMVYSPQAYRAGVLAAALATASPEDLRRRGAEVIPRVVEAAGGRLRTVPAPGEVFRIATTDDLVLAEAMLHVGADVDDERVPR
jgi:2-C-methyl-D-erythritol 4-phosphate cytidylyltransferase